MRMQQMGRATALSPSATTRLVNRLEERGLLTRVLCADDRRGIYTELTEAGQALLADARPVHDETLERALNTCSHTLYHPVGTCRMGTDADSVVDPQLRVRGVDGLRIADASVMPTIIRGHTHAPSVLIGEKASDLIKSAST